MIIRTCGVGWDIGGRTILHDIDVQVGAGEVVGLIGPNGSGKSSLLRLIAGLRAPTRGRVLLRADDLHRQSRREVARQVAFVEQAAVTDQNPTVRDVLELGRTPHRRAWAAGAKHDREVIARVARETELDGMLAHRYGSLSGGERQRVQIARGFVQEPRLLVLDEPTNHLDVKYQLSLLELVAGYVRRTAAGAVIAVHDMNLAAMYCDRIVVLSGGRVVAEGVPGETVTQETLARVFSVVADVSDDDAGRWVRLRRR